MDNVNPSAELWARFLALTDSLDMTTKRLLADGQGMFKKISLDQPTFVSAEASFLRAVTWLYVLWHEVGKVNVRVLAQYARNTYNLDGSGRINAHFSLVHSLRTWLAHNLSDSTSAQKKVRACAVWFSSVTGVDKPVTEDQWNKCLVGLLTEAVDVMEMLTRCLQLVAEDAMCDVMCEQWRNRRDRQHEAHEFHRIIESVSAQFGLDVDPVKFCEPRLEKWRANLDVLPDGYDFVIETTKLVAAAISTDLTPRPPITPQDIIEVLGEAPGPRVDMIFRRALDIHQQGPCTREQLLECLRSEGFVKDSEGRPS